MPCVGKEGEKNWVQVRFCFTSMELWRNKGWIWYCGLTKSRCRCGSIPVIASAEQERWSILRCTDRRRSRCSTCSIPVPLQRTWDPWSEGTPCRKNFCEKTKVERWRIWLPIAGDWQEALKVRISSALLCKLYKTVMTEYKTRKIFPPPEDLFNAFPFYSPSTRMWRWLTLDRDPYPQYDGQAHGLCFSVKGVEHRHLW